MAVCDVLYHDPAHVSSGDRWRPCTAPGQVWTDPDQVLRWVCIRHRRQLVALCAAGLAGRVRWQRLGLATGSAPASEEQAR
jgi:hypothetical protein